MRPDKVRDVIGSGGKNIRQIVAETGVEINVEDDGTVTIASSDAEAAARAVAMVKWLTEDAEVGKIYKGTVKKIVDFGAFVEILPGYGRASAHLAARQGAGEQGHRHPPARGTR